MGTHCRERDVFPSLTSPIISFRSPILWHLKLTFKLRNKNRSQEEIDSHPRQVSCIEILEFALVLFSLHGLVLQIPPPPSMYYLSSWGPQHSSPWVVWVKFFFFKQNGSNCSVNYLPICQFQKYCILKENSLGGWCFDHREWQFTIETSDDGGKRIVWNQGNGD